MNRFLNRLKTRTGIVSTVACVVIALVFIRLGMWQLDRADEKNGILDAQSRAMALTPLESLQAGDEKSQLYRRVSLSGVFDFERQFLLDNRTVNGQPGFDVLAPLYLSGDPSSGGDYVIVNRGWVGHNGDRQVSLSVDTALQGEVSLEGILATPSRGFTLGSAVINTDNNWPVLLQFIDYETIASKLDKIPVLEAVIIADQGQPASYVHHWKPVASGAEKHLGYAFQWFAMLAALIALYLYLMVFKND